ncbi:MAG TPA: aminopeptidase P family protein [Aggregatilineales bacterium]|nr:aminopeptidase P family protein [Anaerolineales bacterium]HRE49366.1 aminopeptidase P family protein [Aggregatilineales bacterium]
MSALYAARLEKLYGLFGFDRAAVDVIALIGATNLAYLTGVPFEPSSRPLFAFFRPGKTPAVVIPALEFPKLEHNAPYAMEFFTWTDAEGVDVGMERAMRELRLFGNKIGVEGMKMRYAEGQLLQRHAHPVEIRNIEGWLAKLRVHKDAAEIDAMRRAIRASEAALAEIIAQVRPGMTEVQIARRLEMAQADHGGQGNAFETTVLSGAKSALPHGNTAAEPVREGEFLLFDFGTKVDGYCSDITRTFVVGTPRDELVRIYEAVLGANEAGRKAARPGVPAQEVDRAARKVIEDAGFGQYFIHRTGHGLGMDVHEEPYIREGNEILLEAGHVHTIEPGVYIPGVGGVRIEDDMWITEDGAESLTNFPRELQRIGG